MLASTIFQKKANAAMQVDTVRGLGLCLGRFPKCLDFPKAYFKGQVHLTEDVEI